MQENKNMKKLVKIKICGHKKCAYRLCIHHWRNRKSDDVKLFDLKYKVPTCKRNFEILAKTPKRKELVKKNKLKIRNISNDKVYNTIAEASEIYKIRPESIRRCCDGKQHTAGGWKWEYLK